MRVLVTGHQGYLGTVMVPILQAAGHDVTGLDSGFFADCVLGPAADGPARNPGGPARRQRSSSWRASTRSFTSRRCPTIRSVRWHRRSPTTSTTTPRSGWRDWPKRLVCGGSSTRRPARCTERRATTWSPRARRCDR